MGGNIWDKKEGIINEIVYEYTTYHNGKYRYYPTITGLTAIINKIKEVQATTKYLRITPFYVNEHVNLQKEYDEYMFYLECRETFDEEILQNHISDCLENNLPLREKKEIGKILYPLCKWNDVNNFNLALNKYLNLLDKILPNLLKNVMNEMKLEVRNLAFGYFYFEIHSE